VVSLVSEEAEKILAKLKATRPKYKNRPKNSTSIHGFMLSMHRGGFATQAQLARAFGVSSATLAVLCNIHGRSYRKLHAEFMALGLEEFAAKYHDEDLLYKLLTLQREESRDDKWNIHKRP
jgi:hypothetical protein